jgi:phenylpropionate dioxygenase-like ring-hydroxylating dioxygenase large terminal subunit
MLIQNRVNTMSAALSVERFKEASPDTYPRGLPPWTYDCAALTRLEIERVLRPSWQLACHISNVPASGDYLTFDIGTDNIVVLRDREGTLRAYHNVCRHRAARLLEHSGSCPGSITCPYHGWTYNLDGSLRGTPVRDSFPALDRAKHGLLAVRVHVMAGLVFVCLEGNPPTPTDMWGDMVADFAPYQSEAMQPLFPMYYENWDVDWKVAMDNYLESYHVPIGHPGLARMMTPDYEDTLNLESGVARGVSWLRDQPSSKWMERQYQSMVRGLTTHLPEPNRKCWRFYSMLPNLGIDIYPDQMDFFQVLPRGPGKCTIRGGTYGLPDNRREMRALRYLGNRINMSVNKEDHDLCRRVQLGLASSVYRPGPLSTLEVCILQFHDLIRQRIPETLQQTPPHSFR